MKKVVPLRIPVYIETQVIADGKKYSGIIGNLSEYGAFVEIDNVRSATPFMPRKKIELQFNASPRKNINLPCDVVWLYSKRTPPSGLINSIGLEIIKPSAAYKKFFRAL